MGNSLDLQFDIVGVAVLLAVLGGTYISSRIDFRFDYQLSQLHRGPQSSEQAIELRICARLSRPVEHDDENVRI